MDLAPEEIRIALRTLTGEWRVMSAGIEKDRVWQEIERWAKLDKQARK